MKKSLLFYSLLAFIIGLGLTSCSDKDDEYVVKSNFDYTLLPITRNGDFEVGTTINLEDIPNINFSREDIVDIYLKNAWINVSGDLSRNDDIRIYSITINGKTLNLNYDLNLPNNIGNNGVDVMNDNEYIDFMYYAMNLLNQRGKINVTISGYSYLNAGRNLYITLCNNLDVTVREY